MSRTIHSVTGSSNNIKKTTTYSDITLDNIAVSQYQKEGTLTAQIRQTVTTVSNYPSKQIATNMQQNLFDGTDFGFDGQNFTNTEERVAWILVPLGTTAESLKDRLAKANAQNATIYRVMSNRPILDEAQQFAVKTGLNGVTMDTFANSQIVRFPKGHPQEGLICLDANNKVQYRRTFFWLTPLEDQDKRTTDPADVYLSPEVTMELNGASANSTIGNVMEGQTL